MIRPASMALAACMALLAACSSSSGTVYERLGPLVSQQLFGGAISGEAEAPPEAFPLTREAVNQIPYATILLRVGDSPGALVVPVADTGGFLFYQDPARRGIVMQGGLITATHGFGYNLDSVKHQRDDPVVVPTPLPQWPSEVVRSYAFTMRGQTDYEIAVVCTYQRGVREFVEIVELRFEVVRMVEICANQKRRFVNTYWAAPGSGFIWKSEQWVGPRLSPFGVEIVRPYRAA
jgi:hypothetical protein